MRGVLQDVGGFEIKNYRSFFILSPLPFPPPFGSIRPLWAYQIQADSLHNLKIKNGRFLTPLNALILTLNDSANALVPTQVKKCAGTIL